MSKWEYSKGLHEISGGVYAYLQPDGSWGLSNAGLVTDNGVSLLIDTLYDLELTQDMLRAMNTATQTTIMDYLVITHANGDHCYGNQLVKGAEIISTTACAEEMLVMPPEAMAQIMAGAPQMGELGQFLIKCFGRFNFQGITLTPPTRTFDKRLELQVGNKNIVLLEVGPCHTKGDLIVILPDDKIAFAADLLFIDGTPVMWDGPLGNWLKGLDQILDSGAVTIIPGHGPITNQAGVRQIKNYWEYLAAEARKRFDAGLPPLEAALDINLGEFAVWGDSERIAVNVDALYREFSGDTSPGNPVELFGRMAEVAKRKAG
jgi:glyoxylase-like metal-dependent hydrolase (beta-lactamase superfamily II)